MTGVNNPPIALGETYSVDEGASLTVSAPGVLANDNDVEGGALQALLVSPPAHGVATLNLDGEFTYTPDPDFTGTDSFIYQSTDGLAASNAVKVRVTVVPDLFPPPPSISQESPDTGRPQLRPAPATNTPTGGILYLQDPEIQNENSVESNNTASAAPRAPLLPITEQTPQDLQSPSSAAPEFGELFVGVIPFADNETDADHGILVGLPEPAPQKLLKPKLDYRGMVADGSPLWNSLDAFQAQAGSDTHFELLVLALATGGMLSLSVGYAAWTIRGGYLLISILAQMPAWRLIDPLPVLEYPAPSRRNRKGTEDDETFESIIDQAEKPNQQKNEIEK
jgi:hypothetical protein